MGTKVNTSYGTKLKYNQPLTCTNLLLGCGTGCNMLNFVVTMCIVKCFNRYVLINTFVYAVGTKENTSYRTKLKYNQPLTFMNTLLVCLTDLNMLNFTIKTHIVKYCNSYI